MALGWKARRRWALVVLLVGLPVYIGVAINLVARFERPSLPLEFCLYVVLGVIWVLPFRPLFRGIGQPEPEDEKRR